MNDRQNITIRITDLAPMPLQINRAEEEVYRIAEANVNKLYKAWKQRYHDRSPKEVLAMVAFQFAKLYSSAMAAQSEMNELLDGLDQEFDRLLFDAMGQKQGPGGQ